jgi:uncharacterized repeat protein (TIGR01451 family)
LSTGSQVSGDKQKAAVKGEVSMHMTKILRSALVLAGALALYLPLHAEVKVVLVANKIVAANGVEHKQSADTAKPGDVIEYVAEYKNPDKSAVADVMATLPVPAGMEYIPQSAAPVPVMASTDGVNYAPVPLKRNVRGADGKMVEQLVPYSEYRSLRWSLGDLAGGMSKWVKARMKVKAAN